MSSRVLRTLVGPWFLTLTILTLATSIATATSPGLPDPMREARTGLPLMPGLSQSGLLPASHQAFPFTQLDRDPTEGARHGFVQTTSGRFGFEVLDVPLPSRVPFQLGRTYDAGIIGMIPGVPTQEPRINYDFGPNWILKPTAGLIPTSPTTFLMLTDEGLVVPYQKESSGPKYWPAPDRPTAYGVMEPTGDGGFFVRHSSGLKYTFRTIPSDVNYWLTKKEDASGNALNFTYNGGMLQRIDASDGYWVQFLRPVWGESAPAGTNPKRIVRITFGLGTTTAGQMTFQYSVAGRLWKATGVDGGTWEFVYDSADHINQAIDPLGRPVFTITTVMPGHKATAVRFLDRDTAFNYLSNKTTVTEEDGGVFDYEFDARGNTTKITDAEGGITQITRDAVRNDVTQIIDPTGGVHAFQHDTQHRITQYSAPLLNGVHPTWNYSYDTAGRLIRGVAPGGAATALAYDAAGRLISESVDPGSDGTAESTTTYERSATNGDVLARVDADGRRTEYVYNAWGQMTAVKPPCLGTAPQVCPEFQWDWTLDKPSAFRWPLRAGSGGATVYSTWSYTWSTGGKLLSMTTPIGGVTSFTYNLAGAMTQMTEPNGAVWAYTWRADGGLSRIDNPLGNAIQFDFDDSGRIYRKIDELGKYWRYYWDRMGRLKEAVDPENRSRKWRYDAAGRVTEDEAPGGRFIQTSYNALGYPVQRTLPGGGSETMTWDARGNVLTLERTTPATPTAIIDRVTNTWDGRALPLSVRVEAGVQDAATKVDRTLNYAWTAAGRPTSYTDSDGAVWTAALDAWGRVTSATAGAVTNTIDYDPWTGWISHMLLTDRGIEESYTYDDAGNALTVLEKKQGVVVTNQAFSRDAGGQIAWITDARSNGLGTGSVDRDLLGRPLRIAWGTGPVAAYTWSVRSELLTTLRSNVTSGTELTTLEYDGAGLLTSERTADYEANYTWTFAPADPATAVEVTRWGAGQDQSPTTIRYGVDGQVLEMRDEGTSPGLRRAFRWMPGGIGVPIAEDRYDAAGALISAARFVGALGEVSGSHSAQTPGAAASWKRSSLLVFRSLESGNWRQLDGGLPFADRDEARLSVTGAPVLGALVSHLGGFGITSGLGLSDGAGLISRQERDAVASLTVADYAAVVPNPDFNEPGVGLPNGASAAESVLHPQRWNDGKTGSVQGGLQTSTSTFIKPSDYWKLSRCAFYETCDEASWPGPPTPAIDPNDADDCSWDGRSQPPAPVRNADVDGIGVSLPSGELTLDVTDLVLPGNGIDAVFTRSYHSQERFYSEHWLGYGWFLALLDERVTINGHFADVWLPGGSRAAYRIVESDGAPLYYAASDRGKLRSDTARTFYEHRDTNGTVRHYEQSAGYHLTRVSRPGAGPITITWAYLARYGLYYPTRVSTWSCDDDPSQTPAFMAACTSDVKKELSYVSFNVVLDTSGAITSGDFAVEGQGIRLKRLPGIVVLGNTTQQQSHVRSICYSYNIANAWAARLSNVKITQANNCSATGESVASYDYASSTDLGNLTSIRDGAGGEVARIAYKFDDKVVRENDVVETVTTPGTAASGDAPALTTTYNYSVAGRRTVTTGTRVSTRYYVGVAGDLCAQDPSHLSRVVRPDNTEILYEYDDHGRLLKTLWPTGREEQWKYAQGDYYGSFLEAPIQYRVIPSTTSNGEERQVTCYLPDPLTGGRWRALGPLLLPAPPPPGTAEPDPCVYTDANGALVPRASESVANWMQAKLGNLEGMTADTVSKDVMLNSYFTRWHINLLGLGSQYPSPFPFRGETPNENAAWPWFAPAKLIGVASTKTLNASGEAETLTTWQRPVTTYEYGNRGRLMSVTNPLGGKAIYRYFLPGETGEEADRHIGALNLGLLAEVETRPVSGNALAYQKFIYDHWANAKEQWSQLESVSPIERWIIKESVFDMRGRVTLEARRSSQTTPDAKRTEARFRYDAASRLAKKIVETTDPNKTPAGKTWALITYEYNSAGLVSAEKAWGELLLASPTTDPDSTADWTGSSTGPYSESRAIYDTYGQAIQSATLLSGTGSASRWSVTRRTFDEMGRLKEERGHESDYTGSAPPAFDAEWTGQDGSQRRIAHRYWYDNPTGNLLFEQVQGLNNASDSTPLISATTKYVYDGHERRMKTIVCDSPTGGTATAVPGCGSTNGLRSSTVHYDFADRPVWSNVCATVAGQHLLQAWTATDYDERDRAYETRTLDGVVSAAACGSGPSGPYLKSRSGYDSQDHVVTAAVPKTTSGWAVSTSTYDELGRRLETTDALGNKVTVIRNYAGLVTRRTITEITGPHGKLDPQIVEFEYDDLARPKRMNLPDGNGALTRHVWHSFDARDSLIAEWAPEGDGTSDMYKSVYEFDGLGRRVFEKRHIGTPGVGGQWLETAFAFDSAGRLTNVEVEPSTGEGSGGIDGQITTYEYDALGRQKMRHMPGTSGSNGRTQAVEFDKLGRVSKTKFCATSATDCTVLESSYDQYSRRTDLSASFTGAAASNVSGARYQHFDFDSLDRITRTIDSLDPIATGSKADDIVTEASFDSLGRIRSESFGNDGAGNTLWPVTSGYNTTGQRTHLTYPAHGTWPTKRLKYTWDDYGRLNTVVDLASDGVTELETIAGYAYSMGSRLVQTTRADGSVWSAPTASAWDKAGRRTGAQVIGTTNAVLFEEKMYFDKNDRVTRIEWPKGRLNETETEAQIYSYDELSRLTNFDQGLLAGTAITTLTSAHEWNLDELGNWRKHRDKSTNPNNPLVDVAIDPVNAYTAWPVDLNLDGTVQITETATLNYDDARGFMVKQPDGTTSGWKYWHDGFGRLSQVDRCQNVACTGTPSWTVEYRYTADGRMATRKKSTDTAATWYLYDGSQVIAEQTATERSTWYVWSGSSLLQSARVLTEGGGVDKLNLHQDRIGNVVLATRLNGASVEMWGRLQFDPYGRKVSNTTWEDHGVHVPYRFAGQRLDPDTNLYLMGARWYSAELGRFIEQDPIAEGGGLNLYAYTGSSPTMWVDPSGLAPEDVKRAYQTPSVRSLAPWARDGAKGGSSFSTKVVVDGVSTVDPLTGEAFEGMVEGFMAADQMAREAGEWANERARAASMEGLKTAMATLVFLMPGAISGDMAWILSASGDDGHGGGGGICAAPVGGLPTVYVPDSQFVDEFVDSLIDAWDEAWRLMDEDEVSKYKELAADRDKTLDQSDTPKVMNDSVFQATPPAAGFMWLIFSNRLGTGEPAPTPGRGGPKASPNFRPPTNPPGMPPTELPPGWRTRVGGPMEGYPNGYWKLEKPMKNGGWQPIDPSTMKPGTPWETHVPFPPL